MYPILCDVANTYYLSTVLNERIFRDIDEELYPSGQKDVVSMLF